MPNYTYTCPAPLKKKFEAEFIQEKDQGTDAKVNTSKMIRIMMELLLEKKDLIDMELAYDEATLKQAIRKGIRS